MVLSIIYVLSAIAALIALLCLPKCETKIVWFPICAFAEIGIFCFVYGTLNLFGVAFSLWLPLVVNIFIIAGVGFYQYKTEGIAYAFIANGIKNSHIKINENKFSAKASVATRKDIIITAIIVILVMACALAQFQFPSAIRFGTSDPAVHLRCAVNLFEGMPIDHAYFTHAFTACFIGSLAPILDPFDYYFCFIFEEIFLFIISGMMLYSIMSITLKNLGIVSQAIILGIYMLGYPWNNFVFGFSYLGAGVSIIATIIFLCIKLSRSESFRTQKLILSAISLMLFNLIVSYPLFVPAVYIAVFIILIAFSRTNSYTWKRGVLIEICVFILPVLLGFFTVFIPMFGGELTIADAISNNGGIYRDLYAGFIFIAPLAIYGLICRIKKNGIGYLEILLFSYLAFYLICFALSLYEGIVSPYYFYKLYFPLWLFFFVYTAFGTDELRVKSASMLASYAGVWLTVFALAFTGLDVKFSEHRPFINTNPSAQYFFPIYPYNIENARYDRLTSPDLELFEEAQLLKDEGNTVEIIADDVTAFWYKALTRDQSKFHYFIKNDSEIAEIVDQCDYMVIENEGSGMTTMWGTTYDELSARLKEGKTVIFENEAGQIIKIH